MPRASRRNPAEIPASPGSLGRRRWEKTLPCPPCSVLGAAPSPLPSPAPPASVLSCPPRTSPTGRAPSGEVGRTPPRESFPPPTPLLAVLSGTSLHLLPCRSLARGRGWGFLCARGGNPEPPPAAGPTKGGTFLLQRPHFWVTPHGAFTCVLDGGKLLAAPPGTWSRPPGRAADGLPAALRSWKRSPNPARAPCDTSEHRGVCTALPAITRAWLSPSTGASSAALPPASSAPSAGKNHLRGSSPP